MNIVYIVCLFNGGMHNTFKQEKTFFAFQNISLDCNLGNQSVFERVMLVFLIFDVLVCEKNV